MLTLNHPTLNALHELGVKFSLRVPNGEGEDTVSLSVDDLLKLAADPDAFYAAKLGVSKEQFRDWRDDGFSAYCAATTRKGSRCKQYVIGGHHVTAMQWVAMQGGYCEGHAGETRAAF